MNIKQVLIGTVVLGIILNVFDGIVWGWLLGPSMSGIAGMSDMNGMAAYWIIGDFVGAAVFTWFFGVVGSVFSSGWKYGLATAFVVSVPTMILFPMMIKGYPSWLMWFGIAYSLVEYAVLGQILVSLSKMINKSKA